MKNHKYTTEEVKQVYELFPKMIIQDIANKLHMSWGNVYAILYYLRKAGIKMSRPTVRRTLETIVNEFAATLKKK